MHKEIINETTFHFNPDMSGCLIIKHRTGELVLPPNDIIDFVLNRLRDEKISRLESMTNIDLKIKVVEGL